MTEAQVRQIVREELVAYHIQLAELPPSDWARDQLSAAVAAGITDGKRPRSFATREEVAIMVRKALEGK